MQEFTPLPPAPEEGDAELEEVFDAILEHQEAIKDLLDYAVSIIDNPKEREWWQRAKKALKETMLAHARLHTYLSNTMPGRKKFAVKKHAKK